MLQRLPPKHVMVLALTNKQAFLDGLFSDPCSWISVAVDEPVTTVTVCHSLRRRRPEDWRWGRWKRELLGPVLILKTCCLADIRVPTPCALWHVSGMVLADAQTKIKHYNHRLLCIWTIALSEPQNLTYNLAPVKLIQAVTPVMQKHSRRDLSGWWLSSLADVHWCEKAIRHKIPHQVQLE